MTAEQQRRVQDNLGLVRWVLGREFRNWTTDEDVYQAGTLGLCVAVERWDERAGTLANYAHWWIRSYVSRAIAAREVVHTPERRRQQGVTARSWAYDAELAEASPLQPTDRLDARRAAARALRGLDERQRRILLLRHAGELTLKEVGAVIGLTGGRVQQIEAEAMERIRARVGA